MRLGGILTILFALSPMVALADDPPRRAEPAPQAARRWPNPADVATPNVVVAPGVIRQDLFDRRNPNNLRTDYPAAPAQPGQF
jgi:hypothetical protein